MHTGQDKAGQYHRQGTRAMQYKREKSVHAHGAGQGRTMDKDRGLESWGGRQTHQDRAVLLLEDGHLVDAPAGIHSLHNVSELSVYIGCSAHTLQGSASLLNLATLHKTVGGVGDDQTTQEEDEGGHNGKTHGQTPAVGVHVLGAVVDPLGDPDTDGGGHLEHDVEGTTGMSRGNL